MAITYVKRDDYTMEVKETKQVITESPISLTELKRQKTEQEARLANIDMLIAEAVKLGLKDDPIKEEVE